MTHPKDAPKKTANDIHDARSESALTSAISRYLAAEDPKSAMKKRMIFSVGAFVAFGALAFPQLAQAAPLIPSFTDAVMAAVSHYPTSNVGEIAAGIADGASSYSSLANEVRITDNPATAPVAPDGVQPGPGLETFKNAFETVKSYISSGFEKAADTIGNAIGGVSAISGMGAVALARYFLEAKGAYDLLSEYYQRWKNIHPEQKIEALEEEVRELTEDHDRRSSQETGTSREATFLANQFDDAMRNVEKAGNLPEGSITNYTDTMTDEEKINVAMGSYVGGQFALERAIELAGSRPISLSKGQQKAVESMIRCACDEVDRRDGETLFSLSHDLPARDFASVQKYVQQRKGSSSTLWEIGEYDVSIGNDTSKIPSEPVSGVLFMSERLQARTRQKPAGGELTLSGPDRSGEPQVADEQDGPDRF